MLEKTVGLEKSSSIADAIGAIVHLDYQTLKDVSNNEKKSVSDLELKVEDDARVDNFSPEILNVEGYNTTGYDPSFMYELNKGSSSVYESKEEERLSDVSSESLTVPEAEVTVKDVQYATAMGTLCELDHRERKKLSNFAMFEPALLRMFEALHGVTRDVNYSYN